MMPRQITKTATVFFGAFCAAGGVVAASDDWRIYAEPAKGDVYFYDPMRIEARPDVKAVWTRIRYKNSVMGAASYEGLLEVDCVEQTERTLQRTFFSDRNWEDPAMATDMKVKKKRRIRAGSATAQLAAIVCAP